MQHKFWAWLTVGGKAYLTSAKTAGRNLFIYDEIQNVEIMDVGCGICGICLF